MTTNFRCCLCGDAAVTAHIHEDGSEHMYCAAHIMGTPPDTGLDETRIDGNPIAAFTMAGVFAARSI